MTQYTRVTGKLFGENATVTATNPEIGQFGSAKAGTYYGTTDVATIQNLAAWQQGWAGAVTETTNFPALPEMTGFGKVLSYQTCYLLQAGIPEWDSGTIYYTNDYCRVGNQIYYSLTDTNQGNNPTSDTTNWKLRDISYEIGDPIMTLGNTLADNEIWLNGAAVSRTTYAALFSVYGTTYGEGDGSTTFNLPDFQNRAIWGSSDFGYLTAGLPNITGTFRGQATSGHSIWLPTLSGAFYNAGSGSAMYRTEGGGSYPITAGFQASRSNSIYGASGTVQPPAIKVRVKTKYQ